MMSYFIGIILIVLLALAEFAWYYLIMFLYAIRLTVLGIRGIKAQVSSPNPDKLNIYASVFVLALGLLLLAWSVKLLIEFIGLCK